MPVPTAEILRLAKRNKDSELAYASFLDAFRSLLTTPRVELAGRALSFGQYLDAVLPAGAPGDEAPVVDALMRDLLAVLGYDDAHVSYNRKLPLPGRAVPDFTIRIPEVLQGVPVFVVEDKATAVRDFFRPRRGRDGADECPLDQLHRYVAGGAVHGRVGLLFNGALLEAWDFGGDHETRLAHVDVHALASSAADGTFPGSHATALRVLWDRFSRASFTTTWELTKAAVSVPKPTGEWKAKIKAAAATADAATFDRVIGDYHESLWRQRALDVTVSPDLLVESLGGLIDLFADDVCEQIRDALARSRAFDAASETEVRRADLDGLRQQVLNFRPSFRDPEFDGLFLAALDDFRASPRLQDVAAQVKVWLAELEPHFVRAPDGPEGEQIGLAMPGAEPSGKRAKKNGTGNPGRRRVFDDLGKAATRYCRAALDLHGSRSALATAFRPSLRASAAFRAWADRVSTTVLVGVPEEELVREFALQTAYVYVVRLLLVRICEDKELFRRKLSDGGLVMWHERVERYLDYASGRSYEYLTRMAYDCAQNVYTHFYGASELFDWYRMDDKMLLRALLVLDCFDLARIDSDIIGGVYGWFLRDRKHEQGRYYTPRPLVRLMLDRAGWTTATAAGRRMADLACGSGSFLVEACRRLVDGFRGPDGEVPAAKVRDALDEVRRSIHGIDLNPFACYLAETNLLIQVLDLLKSARKAGINLVVERFHVYCADALLVDEAVAESPDAAVLLGREQAVAELIKARVGGFEDGFDVLVGNPPYVRADEESEANNWVKYRRLVEAQGWFKTRHQKWDLYVPFVEQFGRMLSDKPDSRACLITIESIGTAPYALKLREFLTRDTTVHDVLFTEGLRLFEDAAWQDNTVFTFSRGAPGADHNTHRQIARKQAEDGTLLTEPLDELRQAGTSPDRLLNPRPEVRLDLADTVLWEEVCYVTVGMVLNANEKIPVGKIIDVPAAYDPARFGEELVEDLGVKGKRVRHRFFGRDELIASSRDDIHSRPYIGSEEVRRGGIGRCRWLEFGEDTRCPSRVRRPTFPELYDRMKVMFGTFTGIAVDAGGASDFAVTSDSVRLAIRWCLLEDVNNRPLRDWRDELARDGRYDPRLSDSVSDWYLCALALSEPIQKWLTANKRSMKEHVYPDDIRAIPVKLLAPDAQQPFIDLAKERHALWSDVVAREADGFRLSGDRVELPVHVLALRFLTEHPEHGSLTLFQATGRGLLGVDAAWLDRPLAKARAVGGEIRVGRDVVGQPGPAIADKEGVARVLARLLAALPGTFSARASQDRLPATEAGILALGAYLDAQAAVFRALRERIAAIGAHLDAMAWDLYRPKEGQAPAVKPPPAPAPTGPREPAPGPLL